MSLPRSADAVEAQPPIRVAVLGSTGSIGRQAVDVLAGNPRFRVVALAAGSNAGLLAEQATRLRPAVVAIDDEAAGRSLRERLPIGIAVEGGDDALIALATRSDVDIVVVGTGGIVSL